MKRTKTNNSIFCDGKIESRNYRLIRSSFFVLFFIGLFGLCLSCKDKSVPRNYGYFRISLPEPKYTTLDTLKLPFRFDVSNQVALVTYDGDEAGLGWFDLNYPQLKGKLHCSYKNLNENLQELSEDSRRFVYAHSNQAEAISEQFFEHDESEVYGILYDLKGNVASPLQFVLTDSTKHFFRAALYFETVPNKDSIAPVLDYVRRDLIHLIESFNWKR